MFRLRRDRAIFLAVLCTALAACAPAAAAASQTGGASVPALVPPTADAGGYGDPSKPSLVISPIAVLGTDVLARGTMPGRAGRVVVLQRLDERRGWRNVARTRVRSTERFAVRWHADRSGRVSLRAILTRYQRTSVSAVAPATSIHVYRPARATFFGPGFFGKQTACGQIMAPDLQGVAHKRLPCGTLVAITYAGREVIVPVVDRGPFNGDYSWDLTQATADALGFAASGEIGYVRVEAPPEPAP
jgi:hypothetical protein